MPIRFLSVLLPWAYVPLLWFFGINWNDHSDAKPTLAPALLPVAVWLGRRYGWQGVATTAIGGIGLPLQITFGYNQHSLGGHADIFVLALCGSALAAGLFSLRRCLEFIRARPLAWLLIVLLPWSISLGAAALPAEAELKFEGSFYLLFWAAIILAGMSKVEWTVLLLPAAAILWGFAQGLGNVQPAPTPSAEAEAGGVPGVCEIIQLSVIAIHYCFNKFHLFSAAALVSLAGYFGLGRWLARARDGRTFIPAEWKAYTVVFLLLIFGIGCCPYAGIFTHSDTGVPRALEYITGDHAAQVLAALLGGLLLGRSGLMLVATVLVFSDYLDCTLSLSDPENWISLGWNPVLLAVAFGTCGIQLRRHLPLAAPPPPNLHLKYMTMIGLGAVSLLPEGKWLTWRALQGVSFCEAWATVTILLMMIGIGLRIWSRRRAMKNPSLESEYVGWIALTALIAAGIAIGKNIGAIRKSFEGLPLFAHVMIDGVPVEPIVRVTTLFLVLSLGLAVLWILLTTAKETAVNLHKSWRDGRRALGKLAGFFGLARIASWLEVPEPVKETKATAGDDTAESKDEPQRFPAWHRFNRNVLILAIVSGGVYFTLSAFE